MNRSIWGFVALLAGMVALGLGGPAQADDDQGWIQLFNGKNMDGWKTHAADKAHWEVKDGVLVGSGPHVGHLFTERGDYKNFHFRLEAKISDGGNSGQYFRAKYGPSYPKGYEAQINSSHPDPQRTGGLYNFVKVKEQLVKPGEWFTQEVIAVGNHIIIKVDGKTTVDYVDKKNTYMTGHLALQMHGPTNGIETMVQFRKLEVKVLP